MADASGDRLFIADSSHNRIVVTKLDGTLVETIGSGERGALDGPSAKASFSRPQGMALDGDSLFIADTENDLIRRVDLTAHTVETIAGTGQQSFDELRLTLHRGLEFAVDLQLVGGTLYMRWLVGIRYRNSISPGTRWRCSLVRDERIDKMGHCSCRFAQPSGITTNGQTLYVADSEANVIRAMIPEGSSPGGAICLNLATRMVGGEAWLQHPLGVLSVGDKILIADTTITR